MDEDTYYRDHWLDVEPERIASYQEMFKWRAEMAPLLASANIQQGQTVVDYGCGPGGLTLELARRVGPSGYVHGIDLNAEFVALAKESLELVGYGDTTAVHHVTDDKIPLPDASIDRLVSKNVMEYVPDVAATLTEFRRVTKPGGLVHIIDSDWGMLVVEPLGAQKLSQLFEAARLAYHTPHIGRILYSEMKKAGFANVSVQILASPDTKGHLQLVLRNMVNYAKISGRLDPKAADAMLAEVRQSIADETYLLVLPQFLATGVA